MRRGLFLFCLLQSTGVMAQFGLGPCCSGGPCGIIPCDSMCAGPAISTMGTSFANNISTIANKSSEYNSKLSSSTTEVTSFYQAISSQYQTRLTQTLQGLDAAAIRLQTATDNSSETLSLTVDNLVSSTIGTLSGLTKATAINGNVSRYGERGQSPVLNDLSNESKSMLEAAKVSQQTYHELLSAYSTYYTLRKEASASATRSSFERQYTVITDTDVPLIQSLASNTFNASANLSTTGFNILSRLADGDDLLLRATQFKNIASIVAQSTNNNDESLRNKTNRQAIQSMVDTDRLLFVSVSTQAGIRTSLAAQAQQTNAQLAQLMSLSRKRQQTQAAFMAQRTANE